MINLSKDSEERIAPVQLDDVLDVKITGTGRQGDGIAKVNEFIIFVKNTMKGDQEKIRITLVRNNFAIGEKIEE